MTETSARRGAVLALLVILVAPVAADEAYRAEIQKWREAREAELRADGGWLTTLRLAQGVPRVRCPRRRTGCRWR